MNKGKPRPTKSTREDKLTWLLNHQPLWDGWMTDSDPRKRSLVEKMREEGLISKTTWWRDLNLTRLIGQARKVRREK